MVYQQPDSGEGVGLMLPLANPFGKLISPESKVGQALAGTRTMAR